GAKPPRAGAEHAAQSRVYAARGARHAEHGRAIGGRARRCFRVLNIFEVIEPMLRRSVLTAAFAILVGVLAPALPAAAAADPAAMISTLGSRALEVLGKGATQAQRTERFRELLREDFDVPGIARFV